MNRERVWVSVLRQPERTLVHLVNGNYDNDSQSMDTQHDLQLELSVDEPVARIWLTTPDQLSHRRRRVLGTGEYSCAGGTASLRIPELDYHVIAVLEHGSPWDPVYEPMALVFPFPVRRELPAGNEARFVALPTEGMTCSLDWTAEQTDGSAADAGTIDEMGLYRAPRNSAGGREIRLRASSREEPSVCAELRLIVTPNLTLPWRPSMDWQAAEQQLPRKRWLSGDGESAARMLSPADQQPLEERLLPIGSVPGQWEIVEGRGDWQALSVDEAGLVGLALHNTNIAEATVEPSVQDGAGYATLLSGGDQTWRDYQFRVRWTSLQEPIFWYNLDSERPHTYTGFVFRYRNANNYYMYHCCYDGCIRLYRYLDGNRQQLGEPAAFRYPAVGESSDIILHAVGDDFRLALDGVLIRDDRGAGDERGRYGSIGFGTSFAENRFERIEVREASYREAAKGT